MTKANIILLTEKGVEEWVPFNNNEIGCEIADMWGDLLTGSPEYVNFVKKHGVQIEKCNCFYPKKKRPVHMNSLNGCYGCVFDLDGSKKFPYLRDELKRIPNDVYVCFISKSNTNCGSKRNNYFEYTINQDNEDWAIQQYLQELLLNIGNSLSPKFGLAAKKKLKGDSEGGID